MSRGRPASTCLSLGVADSERCTSCLNPKAKAICLGKKGLWPPNVTASDVTASDIGPTECASGGTSASAGPSGASQEAEALLPRSLRSRKAPAVIYEPEELPARPLPEVPLRKAVQKARTAEIARARQLELEAARAAGAAGAVAAAEGVVLEAKARLEAMATELTELKAKASAGAAAVQQLEAQKRREAAAKRQKTMTAFLTKPLQHQARPRAEPEQLGSGYTARNISSGCFAQHVRALETQIIQLAPDDPLKQLQLGAAINQRLQGIRDLRDRDQEAWGYIRNSLKAFFETLQDKYNGRYPNHIRAAQQAVCAAIANACPPRKLLVIADSVGANVERLSEGRKHWSQWVDGTSESLMDLRGKIRSDSMDEEWIDFAIGIWKDNARRSERAKDSLRNPRDKSDRVLYRVYWLEVRIGDIHELILKEGKRKFNKPAVTAVAATDSSAAVQAQAAVEFHWSWWYTTKVRPFFVKPAGREVCVCVYHLRFDLFVEANYNYLKRLRSDLKLCSCQHTNHKSPIDFRRAYTCTRVNSERFDEPGCVQNTCGTCKDLKLFTPCNCQSLEQLPKIKVQLWTKLDYECKDGTVKQKSDFVPKEVSYSEYDKLFRAYWGKFQLHHDVGKWQDDECAFMKAHVGVGTTFEIDDFGENYHIERTREHQAYYFGEVGVTLYGCMLRIRVEDLSDKYLGPGEKAKLLALFKKLGKLPIVLIAHIIISEDLHHDAAFVQHVNGKIIPEWLAKVAPGVTITLREKCTDGAPNQYKLADMVLWTSKQKAADKPAIRWSFRGTAHGKDDSDPELGVHKNAADRWQLRAGEGEVAKLFTPHDFYLFASSQMRELKEDFFTKRKGVGIYRREFHWIPNKGPAAINRRISGCNRLGDVGIKKLHFFEDIGRPGFVGVRERSCHQCLGACAVGKFSGCQYNERCGHYRILELSPKTAIRAVSTRLTRENGALDFAGRCTEGAFFVTDITMSSAEKFTIFAVSKDSMLREAEEAISADSQGHMAVRQGEDVIDGVRFSCVSAGGTIFASTGLEVVVPVRSILAFDLDMQEIDTSRCSVRVASGRVRKWQLSADGHSDILRLLSETLDDQVAAAVENVSGRS